MIKELHLDCQTLKQQKTLSHKTILLRLLDIGVAKLDVLDTLARCAKRSSRSNFVLAGTPKIRWPICWMIGSDASQPTESQITNASRAICNSFQHTSLQSLLRTSALRSLATPGDGVKTTSSACRTPFHTLWCRLSICWATRWSEWKIAAKLLGAQWEYMIWDHDLAEASSTSRIR